MNLVTMEDEKFSVLWLKKKKSFTFLSFLFKSKESVCV